MFNKETFNRERDQAGLFERAVATYYRRKGHSAELNPAPESDYHGRASHDLTVDGIKMDCKMNYATLWSNNIAFEQDFLNHTKASHAIIGFPVAYYLPIGEYARMLEEGSKAKMGDFNFDGSLMRIDAFMNNPFITRLN